MVESYGGYRLPDLWKILQDEDPESGFTHVNTLNRLRTALTQQRDNLRAHRDRLTEGWPPDRSEAATAFVAQINDMIDALEATAGAAGYVCIGVDEAFAAIRDARRQLEPLVADYGRRPIGAGLAVPTTDNAAADEQARNILIAADAKVVAAARKINVGMPKYRRVGISGEPINVGTDSGSQSLSAGGGGAVATGTRTPPLPAPAFDPPPPSDPRDAATIADSPALASGWPAGGGGIPSTGSPGVIGGGDRTQTATPGSSPLVPIRPGVLPPGGVIRPARPQQTDGPPVSPVTGQYIRPGAPDAKAGQARRGSVSGSETRDTRSTSGTAGGYRDRSYEEYIERRRHRRKTEGNEVWPVAEGVPPVIEPPSERPHDPGPGVLGIDR